MSFWSYRPYVPVAERRAKADKEAAKLKKQGRALSPVVIEGRKIARNFWGKAWCENLERYSDFANRLPRGRAYINNGSLIDLKVQRGKIEALVSGSEIYRITILIETAASARWNSICSDCAGSVGSIVELLQGKMSKHVMERVCREADGLFPAPREIRMSCSCPDWADMCKHVAATLYGVGARVDSDPDVLFLLRGVDRAELVSTGADLSITEAAANSQRVLADDDMAALFGLEIEAPRTPAAKAPRAGRSRPVDVGTERKVAPKPSPARKAPTRKANEAAAERAPATTPEVKPAVGRVSLSQTRRDDKLGRGKVAKWIGARARKAKR